MINLFVNYYNASTDERQAEIDFCFHKNADNPLIDRLIVFTNLQDCVLHCDEVVENDRPTYQDYFNEAAKYPNDINIIANSDIYFDDTIKLAEKIHPNEVFVLTRHEYNNGNIESFFKIHGCPPEWSQDCIIWRGVNRAKGLEKVWATDLHSNQDVEIPYTLGHPGQENHLAWLMRNYGYTVRNPSNSIRAIHVHKERSRPNYKYRIKGQNGGSTWGRLLKVEPCSI